MFLLRCFASKSPWESIGASRNSPSLRWIRKNCLPAWTWSLGSLDGIKSINFNKNNDLIWCCNVSFRYGESGVCSTNQAECGGGWQCLEVPNVLAQITDDYGAGRGSRVCRKMGRRLPSPWIWIVGVCCFPGTFLVKLFFIKSWTLWLHLTAVTPPWPHSSLFASVVQAELRVVHHRHGCARMMSRKTVDGLKSALDCPWRCCRAAELASGCFLKRLKSRMPLDSCMACFFMGCSLVGMEHGAETFWGSIDDTMVDVSTFLVVSTKNTLITLDYQIRFYALHKRKLEV